MSELIKRIVHVVAGVTLLAGPSSTRGRERGVGLVPRGTIRDREDGVEVVSLVRELPKTEVCKPAH